MKIAAKPKVNLLYLYDEIVIPIKHGQIRQINECLDRIGEIDAEAEYTVEIKKNGLNGPLTRHAYCWVLLEN